MCLSFFLLGLLLLLLLLLLCHDILEHGPQPFDLTELIADLLITNALVYVFTSVLLFACTAQHCYARATEDNQKREGDWR